MRTLRKHLNSAGRCLLLVVVLLAAHRPLDAAETNLFFTRFETTEGYDAASVLAGQNGWLGEGTGGNGLVNEFIPGQGQQAYLGYRPPASTNDDQTFLWQPINFQPRAAGFPVVRFSVLMSIVDSTPANDQYDNFRWIVFNNQTNQLFLLDFDNYYLDVSYQLDGTNELVITDVAFTNDTPYTLRVTMNFASNRWSASLDNRLLATNQPITTTGAPLDLGDIDAVWSIFDPANPGDNYLLFDNYQITAQSLLPSRPRLQLLGRTTDGRELLRLTGPADTRFALEATTNFTTWTALKTNVTTDGYFDHIDSSAPAAKTRFYRARWVP